MGGGSLVRSVVADMEPDDNIRGGGTGDERKCRLRERSKSWTEILLMESGKA